LFPTTRIPYKDFKTQKISLLECPQTSSSIVVSRAAARFAPPAQNKYFV
jgi:hypothetical protein